MVSHFHYDPVWWNTQGQFTQSRLLLPGEDGRLPGGAHRLRAGRLHLDAARADPDYKFVLAEIDYLKPYFDAHPEDRADLRALMAEGRIEIVGGNYNEPNTNLTCAESTIRNAVYGIGHQRDVLGGDPRSAWMLDAFGFDPGYPGLMAAAGLTSSAWARGPFHQWGPSAHGRRQHRGCSSAPSSSGSPRTASGLLTSVHGATTTGPGWRHPPGAGPGRGAGGGATGQLAHAAPRSPTTRNVLLPVGADHVIPARWATALHRDFAATLRLAALRDRAAARVLRRRPGRGGQRGICADPADQGHEPGLPGQGRLLHRHQAGAAGGRGRGRWTASGSATLAWLAGAPYPARGAGQGVAAAGVRRPPRRDHRHRVRPGVPGPAGRAGGRRSSSTLGRPPRRRGATWRYSPAPDSGRGRVTRSSTAWPGARDRTGPGHDRRLDRARHPVTLELSDDDAQAVPFAGRGVRRRPGRHGSRPVTLTFRGAGRARARDCGPTGCAAADTGADGMAGGRRDGRSERRAYLVDRRIRLRGGTVSDHRQAHRRPAC